MSLGQAFLLFIFSSISGIGSSTEEFQTHRPIIASTLAGIALGNVKAGVMAGAAMELVALGWMTIGVSVPPDPALAGVVVAVLVILGNQSIGVAVGMAIPLAVAGQLLQIAQKSTIDIAIMHWAERGVEKGKLSRVSIAHYLTAIPSALRVAVPSLCVAYFADATLVQSVFNAIPKSITMGLQIASGFLVVVGYAMIMTLLNVKELLPFFFIGFLVMTFTSTTLFGLTVLAVSLAIIYFNFYKMFGENDGRERRARTKGNSKNDEEKVSQVKISKKDIIKVFWRTQTYQLSWNYERLHNLCYCYCIMPVLKKLYKDEKELQGAVKTHFEYYNTHQFLTSVILGANIAMEEAAANNKDIDKTSITQLKIALMGPLAGIGDSVIWGIARPMAAAVGAGIATDGNIFGPIFFFVTINAIRLFFRYNMLFFSYREGANIISRLKDVLPKMKNVMTVLAYTVMGGLVAKWTKIDVPVVLYSYEKHGEIISVTVQQQLDAIMPNLLPLMLTFLIYTLIKKKVSPLVCIIGLMILGILGYTFGFLG
ncbi:PTS system, mannose/fructose/sorbose family, IID component [Clostridium amylolyticum]|uniref:PTS system, mannose/fructose/sorbose family, IID component n=1 Tax=Clostridium amylolyticum TaxID=1121298 RepID=A0A1M6GVW5_9CLOT|nr:mannose/fructose/sorbose PTS transporter subunit IID [Clostridium amylolyticum]SHJ14020.1 PTS system, mannose/fructose/sorbose family, IID component [Clostridium amylolyticum]